MPAAPRAQTAPLVLDSSCWLEFFADTPHAEQFAAAIEAVESLIVPVLTVVEVVKKLTREAGDETAAAALGLMQRGRVVPIDLTLALAERGPRRARGNQPQPAAAPAAALAPPLPVPAPVRPGSAAEPPVVSALVDSGPLLALFNASDHWHGRVLAWLAAHPETRLVSTWPVLTEVCALLARRIHNEAALDFLR